MKFGNLVEICFWLNLAVKGLKCFFLESQREPRRNRQVLQSQAPTYTELRNSFNQNPIGIWLGIIFTHHLLAHFPGRPRLINSHSFRRRIIIVIHFNNQLFNPGSSELFQRNSYLFCFDPLLLFLLRWNQ